MQAEDFRLYSIWHVMHVMWYMYVCVVSVGRAVVVFCFLMLQHMYMYVFSNGQLN